MKTQWKPLFAGLVALATLLADGLIATDDDGATYRLP